MTNCGCTAGGTVGRCLIGSEMTAAQIVDLPQKRIDLGWPVVLIRSLIADITENATAMWIPLSFTRFICFCLVDDGWILCSIVVGFRLRAKEERSTSLYSGNMLSHMLRLWMICIVCGKYLLSNRPIAVKPAGQGDSDVVSFFIFE